MGKDLTTRQLEVIKHLSQGKTITQISDLLNINTRTVDVHIHEIKKSLNAKTTVEAVLIAYKNNFTECNGVMTKKL